MGARKIILTQGRFTPPLQSPGSSEKILALFVRPAAGVFYFEFQSKSALTRVAAGLIRSLEGN
jgi:hypothetical protein